MNLRRWSMVSLLGLMLIGVPPVSGGPDDPPKPEALAKERLEIARHIYRVTEDEIINPPASIPVSSSWEYRSKLILERIPAWSRRWMEAERDAGEGQAAQVTALSGHIERLRKYEKICEEMLIEPEGRITRMDVDTLKFHRLEAEFWLAKAKADR